MKRWFTLLGLTALLAVGLAVAAPAPAVQAVDPVIPPQPINVLPSAITGGATGLIGTRALEYQAALLYRLSALPQFWTSLAAVQGGTPTPSEVATATQGKRLGTIPVTRLASLVKAVGAASYAYASYSVGVMAGNGVLDLVGVDGDHAVCTLGGDFAPILSMVTMRDCGAYAASAELAAVVNNDAISGYRWEKICAPTGECIQFKGFGPYDASFVYFCYEVSGSWGASAAAPADYTFYERRGTGGWVSSPLSRSGARITACNSVLTGINAGTGQWGIVSSPLNGIMLKPTSTSSTLPTVISEPVPLLDDPLRTFKCVVVGTNSVTYTAYSMSFRESDAEFPQPVCPDLPAGVYPASVTITLEGGPSPIPLYSETSTPEFVHSATDYASCMDGSCKLDLLQNGVSCFTAVDLCTGWFDDPNKVTTYTCRFGSYTVPLAECTVYRPTWEPQQQQSGDTLGDPTTGQPLTNPLTTSDQGTFGSGVQDPASTRQCFPAGWGVLNPVEWVMKPVQCALQWAFVPKPQYVQTTVEAMRTALDDTAPAQAIALVNGIAADLPELSGCSGPHVEFTIDFSGFASWAVLHVDEYPLSACEPPMSDIAPIVRLIGAVLLYSAALSAVIRYLAGVVGFSGFGKGQE